jgi:hypothetical protein
MRPVETRAFDIGFKRPPCMRRSGVLSVSGCFFWYVPPGLFFETQRHRVTEGGLGWKLDGFSRALRGLCASVFPMSAQGSSVCDSLFETQSHRVTEGKDALDFRLRTPWPLCLCVSNVRALCFQRPRMDTATARFNLLP